jgi:glycosyltransferase involved in cell wall biosynthesis
LTSQKNWRLAIKAFALISNRIDDNLIIYGTGVELEDLMKLTTELNLSERVTFAGVSHELDKIVVNAKLFVMSSDVEGSPNALIEALVMGVPCVSTRFDGGGVERLITSGENALVVPKGDAAALAEAMLKLLTDKDYADHIALNAKKRAFNEFNPERIYKEWEQFIVKIVSRYRYGDTNGNK